MAKASCHLQISLIGIRRHRPFRIFTNPTEKRGKCQSGTDTVFVFEGLIIIIVRLSVACTGNCNTVPTFEIHFVMTDEPTLQFNLGSVWNIYVSPIRNIGVHVTRLTKFSTFQGSPVLYSTEGTTAALGAVERCLCCARYDRWRLSIFSISCD